MERQPDRYDRKSTTLKLSPAKGEAGTFLLPVYATPSDDFTRQKGRRPRSFGLCLGVRQRLSIAPPTWLSNVQNPEKVFFKNERPRHAGLARDVSEHLYDYASA
jgi:hypothetical protein